MESKKEQKLETIVDIKQKSWYNRILGRSFFFIIFGKFFEKKDNSAALIAIMLVGTLCFTVIYNLINSVNITEELRIITNVIFVVIGYYFGSKQLNVSDENDE
jgi:hypothetical protein